MNYISLYPNEVKKDEPEFELLCRYANVNPNLIDRIVINEKTKIAYDKLLEYEINLDEKQLMFLEDIDFNSLPDVKNIKTGELSEIDIRNPYKLINAVNITKNRIEHSFPNNNIVASSIYAYTNKACPEGIKLVEAIKKGANCYDALVILNDLILKNKEFANKKQFNSNITKTYNTLETLIVRYSPYDKLFTELEIFKGYQAQLNDAYDGKGNGDPEKLQELTKNAEQKCINMAKEFDPYMLLNVAQAKRKIILQNNKISTMPLTQAQVVAGDDYRATIGLESIAKELIRKNPTSQFKPKR